LITPSFNIENDIAEVQNQRIGYLISGVLHLLLLLLFWLIPLLTPKQNPPQFSGILISLGLPDQGTGDDLPATQNEKPEELVTEEITVAVEEKVEEIKEEPLPAPVIEEVQETNPAPKAVPVKVKTSELEEKVKLQAAENEKLEKQKAAQLVRKKQEEINRKEKEAADKKKREAAVKLEKARLVAEAKRRAEVEAARKKAEYEARKKQFGDVIGKGKGSTGNPGNEGDPNGDPSANKLKGISSGKGEAGDGLGDRGIVFEPTITDKSQKVGKVAIRLCVDKSGTVTKARFTQKGSTTTDTQLIQIAVINVKKYKFTKSEMPEQCGTITIDFKLR